MCTSNKIFSKGQSLVEIIVVIGVVVLLVTGLVAGTTTSLKSSQSGKAKSVATAYAQEGIEYARRLRDEGWSIFSTRSGDWCLEENGTWEQGTTNCASLNGMYTRVVTFTPYDEGGNDQGMDVTSTVSWQEGTQVRSSILHTRLTHWR